MSDKAPSNIAPYFALSTFSIVTIEGVDASKFAQAQFMNDVTAVAPGHWQWNGWLTPKGRVIALFALLHVPEGGLLLFLADADADAFVSQLQRFVFRSKLTLHVRRDLAANGVFRAPVAASGSMAATLPDGTLELDLGTPTLARSLRIGPPARPDETLERDWAAADLAHGLPRLAPGQSGQWTPQQLSLDRLGAFSVKKGCYPGQEIVARTHFLGQAKRGLIRLKVTGTRMSGTVCDAQSRDIGQLVASAGDEALAVMPFDAAGPWNVGGQPTERLPLLDGLAR